jgi:hypothetical protein
MAEIQFKVQDVGTNVISVNGSGLGFFGANYGNSVPTTEYQRSTFVTSADGSASAGAARNTRFLADNNPTGIICTGGTTSTGTLLTTNSNAATLWITFNHTTSVKVQNVQLRIWDRGNIDYPATGVVTKVAELVNFSGQSVSQWYTTKGLDIVAGLGYASGDAFWWGAPWPSGSTYGTDRTARPSYVNSVGVAFYNFTDYNAFTQGGSGNPDSRLVGANLGTFTVGGTGLVVPLLNSPGPSGYGLSAAANTAPLVPKYAQYVNTTYQGTDLGLGATVYNASGSVDTIANASDLHKRSWGGSGAFTEHTWFVALSARPLTIGAKQQYALYISLEYL